MSAGYGVAEVQRPRITKMAETRVQIGKSMRKLADGLEQRHPEMGTHEHVRDAVRALDAGLHTAAGRHLDAAMHSLAPQSLIRHGIRDDDGHANAKRDMTAVWRHSLLVKDLTDLHEETQDRLQAHRERRDALKGPSLDAVQASVDQPPPAGRDQAQAGPPGGGTGDKTVLRMRRTPQQAANIALGNSIELVGPKGYVHGWKFVGVPKFRYPGGQGGNGHISAIYHLGDKYKPTGDLAVSYATGPANDMYTTAMQNVAKAVTRRDMKAASTHLDSAMFAARHMGPAAQADVHGVRRSLEGMSPAVSGRHNMRPGATKYGKSEAGRDAFARSYAETAKHLGLTDYYKMGLRRTADLSAQTARLAVTPAPRGKPGGPGLYGVKGNEHSAYLQQIVKALIEKRGMSPDKAYGVARAAIRKWGSGRGKVRPEVRAAAAAAEGQEISAQARAHMHSNVELAQPQKQQQKKGGGRPQSSNWQGEARVPAGGPTGGQFGSGSSGGQKAKGKPPVSQHGPLAQRRAALLQQAQADREKAHQLMAQLKALTAHHRTTGKSASSAPKAKGAGAQSAKQAKQGQAKTGTKKSAGKTGTATGSAMSTAMKISNLKAEIVRLLLQARKLTHQAHSL